MPTKPAVEYPWCDPGCPSWPHVTHTLTAQLKKQFLCENCGRPARAIFDSTDRWESERNAWYAKHPAEETGPDPVAEPEHDVLGDGAADVREVARVGSDEAEPDRTAEAGVGDVGAQGDGESVQASRTAVAEPVTFPPPQPLDFADQIRSMATDLHLTYPHRTLFECREMAQALFDWAQS